MKDRNQKVAEVLSLIKKAEQLCDLNLSEIPEALMDKLIERNSNQISALEDAKRKLLNIPMLDYMIVKLKQNIEDIQDYKKLIDEFKKFFSEDNIQQISTDTVTSNNDHLLEDIVMHNIEMKNEGPVEQLKIILNKMSIEEIDAGVLELLEQIEKYENDFHAEKNDEKRLDIGLKMDELQGRLYLMNEARALKEKMQGNNIDQVIRNYEQEFNNAKKEFVNAQVSLQKQTNREIKEPGEEGYEQFKAASGLKPTELNESLEEHQTKLGLLGVMLEYVKSVEAEEKQKSRLNNYDLNELNRKITSVTTNLNSVKSEKEKLISEIAKMGPKVTVSELFRLEDLESKEKDLAEKLNLMLRVKESRVEDLTSNIAKIEEIYAIDSLNITDEDLESLGSLKDSLVVESNGIKGTNLENKVNEAIEMAVKVQWEVFFIDESFDEIVNELNETPGIFNLFQEYCHNIESQIENNPDETNLQILHKKLDVTLAYVEAQKMIQNSDQYDAKKFKDVVARLEKAAKNEGNQDSIEFINSVIKDLKEVELARQGARTSDKENVVDWVVKGKESMQKVVNLEKSGEASSEKFTNGPEVD